MKAQSLDALSSLLLLLLKCKNSMFNGSIIQYPGQVRCSPFQLAHAQNVFFCIPNYMDHKGQKTQNITVPNRFSINLFPHLFFFFLNRYRENA